MTETTATYGDADRISASLDAGWQLPAALYSDPAVHEQEKRQIFAKSWYYVGRERDLSEPGSYLTAQLGDLPIVVVRDRAGALHGHVNICRHRLHPVAEGSGCSHLFQCRYHGWTYTHDGSLRSAPGLRDEDAFDRQTLGLRPVSVDTFRGFVFANPDIAAEPLHDYLAGAHELIDELDLDFADWEHAGTYTYDVAANWKLFTENALECYHCPLVHENTYATVFHTTKADYQCTEFDNVAVQIAPVTELTERIAQRPGGLDGFRLLYLWPMTFLSVDDFVGIVARTIPVGAHGSRFVVDAFVKPGTDPAVLEQWLDVYDRTFEEDKTVVVAQQAGYDSGVIPQGRLMTNCESTIAMFQRRTWAALHEPNGPGLPPKSPTATGPAPTGPAAPTAQAFWEADLRVDAVTTEADAIVSLTLRAPDGTTLPPWQPGAHIDLCLTAELTRQYSLCGDPRTPDRWKVAVLDEPQSRGGSAHVHRQVNAGDLIRVRGPRNHFAMPDAPAYLFIAGGIGITPILPMLSEAEQRGVPWQLLYGGRTLSSMAFLEDLERHRDKVLLRPQDSHGLLDLDGFLSGATPGTAVMACGPSGLLDALDLVCTANSDVTLHTERFTASTPQAATDSAFDVMLARSGTVVRVEKERSVLQTLRDHNVPVLSSCREGLCGSCETPVLEGDIDHRDSILTEEERRSGDTMMICVSRCTSPRLVLDL
ncbi:SRPBCC family protein [Nocardia sp. R6R-6]|uniref:SRPBCC family protein n=1 Tax=Nocardia sp. R6R-6 TaxID=3459303 RepID=UPI00403DD12E